MRGQEISVGLEKETSSGYYSQDFDVVDSLGWGRINAFYLSLPADVAFRLLSAALDLSNSAVGAWPVVGLKAPVLCKVRLASCLWRIGVHPLTSFLADESDMIDSY